MRVERPRAARYPLVTSVTLIDLESDHKTVATTRDLSLFGSGEVASSRCGGGAHRQTHR